MRIVVVSWRDLANPLAGGSEILVDRLLRGLQARGHQVVLVSGGPVRRSAPYRIVDAGGTYAQYVRAPWAVVRGGRADLVVDVANGVPFFSPLWRRGPALCLMLHVHTEQWAMRFPAPVAAVGRFVERRIVPLVYRRRLFVAISSSTADGLTRLGIPRSHIRVVEPGVDPVGVREKSAAPTFLVLGRLVPHKRLELVLRVWRKVRPQLTDLGDEGGRLRIVGDGPERQHVEQLVRDDRIPGVDVLGHVAVERRDALLGSAWLLVHTARHEGWGMGVMEAAAAGTPTLALDAPGVRDAIIDGTTGRLAADEAALAEIWVALAHDEGLRRNLAAGGRRWAAEHSWDAAVDGFVAVTQELVDGGHG